MRRTPRFPALTQLLIAALTLVAAAQTAPRELLNSERIAAEFGSYGVAVLEQDDAVRVSNLFSGTGDARTCRTLAIVRYAERIDPAISEEHAEIVAGGSLGATFAARGWEVRKTHLRYGERPASQKLAALMRVDVGTRLAWHAYVLDVVQGERTIEYAALVEVHHPDYLGLQDLRTIYGAPAEGSRPELVASLLKTADERVR
jgi:hypothetical protein